MGRWRTGSYSHYRRTHTSVVLTRLYVGSLFLRYPSRPAWSLRGSSHTPLRGLVVLAVSVTPGVVSSQRFSHAFAWACCSRGIRHARHDLFAALLTCLSMGSLLSRYPSRPAWSLRGSSHTPLRGLVVLTVSITPGVVSSRLFSHAFAWARCSREWWSQRRSRG